MKKCFPILLAIVLYSLIFFLRSEQGGWELKWEVLQPQRQVLDRQIAQLLPSPQAELLSGILLGNKKDLPGQFKLALRDTSTLHIVVASGQNLSLVAGFFLALAGLIKRRTALVLSLGAALFYTVLSGMQVPILRAVIMFSLTAVAQIFGRQKDGVWVLVVTAGLMLLINPGWLTDLSFQLSFLATLGVIVVAPILLQLFKVIPLVDQDLAVTVGAQVLVMPVIVQNFHQLSVVGILANLLVSWTISLIMVLGSIMLLVSLVWVPFAQIIALITNIFLTYFIYIVESLASLPFAWEYVGEQIWVVWVGYYLLIGGGLLAISKIKD